MTRSIRGSRRAAVLLAGAAAATSLLVSGCGAGQIAETALKEPSVQGVNTGTPDGDYLIRGLLVDFPGTGEGYPAGGTAPVSVVLYNDTREPVTVTVSTSSARQIVLVGAGVSPAAGASEGVTPSPSASESAPASPTASAPASPTASGSAPAATATASPSPTESAPAGAPATIEIPPLGYAQLNQQGGRFLQLVGLNEELRAGQEVELVFDFGNGERVSTPAPVGVPLTPQAPPSPIIERHGGEGGEEGGH